MRNTVREWLEGHVTVTIRGKRFERFLNLAVRQGLQIWDIKRVGEDRGQCSMLVRDYKRIRPLLKETGCRSHVELRQGAPFLLRLLNRRLGFAIGGLVFLIGLYMLSTFVWSVEVVGTHRIAPQTVLSEAEKLGMRTGAWQPALGDTLVLQRALLRTLPDASWVGVEKRGTKLVIQVVEKEQPEKPVEAGPRHLVAKKKATVHSILAEKGKTMVEVNQFVEKGQVLISGVIGNDSRQALVAATGKVTGEVWYKSDVTVPMQQTLHMFTGQQERRYYLELGGQQFRLWPFQELLFPHSEVNNEKTLMSLGRLLLPVRLKSADVFETEPQTRKLTREEAVELGKRFAREDVLRRAEKDATIQSEKVLQIKEENGKVYLSMHYSVIEEIAAEQPLVALPPAPSPAP